MSEIKQPGFYDKSDLRSENRELAFKMFFRELKEALRPRYGMSACVMEVKPLNEQILDLIKRWGIAEEEIGTTLSLSITFPDGVERNQWFYDEKGVPYSKKHSGNAIKPPVAKKPKAKVKRKR